MNLKVTKEELKGLIIGITIAYNKCNEVDPDNTNNEVQLLKVIYLRMLNELQPKLDNTSGNISISEELASMQFEYERNKMEEEKKKFMEEDIPKDIIN